MLPPAPNPTDHHTTVVDRECSTKVYYTYYQLLLQPITGRVHHVHHVYHVCPPRSPCSPCLSTMFAMFTKFVHHVHHFHHHNTLPCSPLHLIAGYVETTTSTSHLVNPTTPFCARVAYYTSTAPFYHNNLLSQNVLQLTGALFTSTIQLLLVIAQLWSAYSAPQSHLSSLQQDCAPPPIILLLHCSHEIPEQGHNLQKSEHRTRTRVEKNSMPKIGHFL